jgi:hypothetical protein
MPGVNYGPIKPTPLERSGIKPRQQGGQTAMPPSKPPKMTMMDKLSSSITRVGKVKKARVKMPKTAGMKK